MAKGYRPVARDQRFLFPPDMREWLPADHAVWLVIKVVEDHLDTSAFHARRRTGGAGRAGYDPDMLLALLIWAYAHQVTSSRRIEALCGTDVAFKVICAQDAPDHVTIARFRADFPAVIESLFTQVLALCAKLGMGRLGTVALDGTKVAANASKDANRTGEHLRKLAAEAVAEHQRTDAAEDDLFGQGRRGDEVPPDAARPGSRDARIAAALADLEAGREAAQAARDAKAREHRDAARAGTPKPGNRPAEAAVEVAEMAVERARAAQRAKIDEWDRRNAEVAAAGGRGLPGGPPVPADQHCRVKQAQAKLERARQRAAQAQRKAAGKADQAKGPGPVRNITDPDSRLMPVRGSGFIQGYNAQNTASEDGLIIAAEHTQDTTDTASFEPMLRQAEAAAALITAHQPTASQDRASPAGSSGIGLMLADAGYLSGDNLTCAGPDRLIATGKQRNLEKAARAATAEADGAGGRNGPLAAMAARLATEAGVTAYRKRGHIAETPHGNIKHNLRFRQHTMRGLAKTSAEWKFACTVHNLLTAITSGHLTTAALARLPA